MTCPDGFWCIQIKDVLTLLVLIATIYAIYIGPIKAVEVSKLNEDNKAARNRQYFIFHNLMKTRRAVLSLEHVSALNLIQLEFYGIDKVTTAYKNYISLLSRPRPNPSDRKDVIECFYKDQDDGFFELVHEIGKHLGFTMDKRELEQYSYSPQGWVDNDQQIITLRNLAVELLTGRRSLPISALDLSVINKKFPPPPKS